MELALYTVNAFADKPFTGNPAAVCPLQKWLPDETMQAIAAQNNLAETVFFTPNQDGSYQIRWFTPAREVPLCGHATLASAFALCEVMGRTDAEQIVFHSRSGRLGVSRQGVRYTLDFPTQPPHSEATPSWFTSVFGANPSEFYGGPYKMAVFSSQKIIEAIEPDLSQMARIAGSTCIVTAPGDDHDFVSRFFAPFDGIDEDPVTGSAHCMLTPYWSKRLGKTKLRARQISRRGGEVGCELKGERVAISGQAGLYSKATIFV
ncbi:PhzF family phenazine biosynthesis protein [Pelagicoccus sp. SDUM812003]|uniref:PhzF family phenazine biosynthesis protein n=1 Tax=Pelagicoccus sp. SDUM812003 TaxID=3041267 RepID=UPI00280F99F6|nr:PhzF family phenazine biosynthesis protein [Pelagicoccus sp. SDUM812003]MDQ8203525.1 PhzF family phenazine biosynthesis protein [Pelagicoccus sp. SDUM812003]